MSLFVRRIQQHLQLLNKAKSGRDCITAYKVALEVGLDPTYVTNIFQGRKNGTPQIIKKLAQSQLLNLSYETLRSWQAMTELEPGVLEACLAESQVQFEGRQSRFEGIPCRGEVAAGGFQFYENSVDIVYYEWWDLEDFPLDERASLCCFKVSGDSMWPPIPSGSLLLVREVLPATNLKAGRWYVVFTTYGEGTFKMVTFDPDRLILQPLNLAHSSIPLDVTKVVQSFEVIKYQVSLM